MGHVDPLFVIPIGAFFAVVSAWAAVAPERFPRTRGMRIADRVLGESATTVLFRLGGVVMAVGSAWLVFHATRALILR